MATQTTRFPATAGGVAEVHLALDRLLSDAEEAGHPLPSVDAIALRTASGEVAANIVEHACADRPDAEVFLEFSQFADRVEATFSDPGLPFHDPTEPEDEVLPQGGIGLTVARASVDVLVYMRTEGTNSWILVRQITAIPS